MSQYQYDRQQAGQRGRTGDVQSPNDPSAIGATKQPLYTTKINQETAQRLRIGDPLSPVEPGDIGPTGKPYRKGQYAPTVEELSFDSIQEAAAENLLSKKLPIFTDDALDEDKLDGWNPNKQSMQYGTTISSEVPKHSSAVILSAFNNLGDWLSNLNVAHVFGSQDANQQPQSRFGDLIVQAEVSAENRKFSSNLRVFPKFYKYVAIPMRQASPGIRETGISVAEYAVIHSLGHVVFAKLSFDGKLTHIGDYIEASGWKKRADFNVSSGSYMGYKNPSIWKKDNAATHGTELSRYSPMDDFSEAFALYHTHPDYLQKLSPNRFSVVANVTQEYGAS